MKSKRHQRAGLALVSKYGHEHMRTIGRRGAERFYQLYTWQPIYLAQFALVEKATGAVIAFSDGRPVTRRSLEER